jgi:hypothetical protein
MTQRRYLPFGLIIAMIGSSASAAGISLPPIGAWQGRYRCAQGETALNLAIIATTPSRISAIFYFHALAANPRVPSGCFMMHGRFDARTRRIWLKPAQWLDHPAFFVRVSLSGTVSISGQTLKGSIGGPACSVFTLTRDFKSPSAPAPCHLKHQGPLV